MTDPAIKAALEAAAKCLCICDEECFETRHGMMHGPCERPRHSAAAAIAAFLRACQAAPRWPGFASLDDIAAAVEAAAREGG